MLLIDNVCLLVYFMNYQLFLENNLLTLMLLQRGMFVWFKFWTKF